MAARLLDSYGFVIIPGTLFLASYLLSIFKEEDVFLSTILFLAGLAHVAYSGYKSVQENVEPVSSTPSSSNKNKSNIHTLPANRDDDDEDYVKRPSSSGSQWAEYKQMFSHMAKILGGMCSMDQNLLHADDN